MSNTLTATMTGSPKRAITANMGGSSGGALTASFGDSSGGTTAAVMGNSTGAMGASMGNNPEAMTAKFAEGGVAVRLVDVQLLAASWLGDTGKYSQVVDIAGITKYSKVDLQPSVEQLAVFYEKDIAFTTENVDGVVTVYVVGDKPTNDYTIQATVTEVAA